MSGCAVTPVSIWTIVAPVPGQRPSTFCPGVHGTLMPRSRSAQSRCVSACGGISSRCPCDRATAAHGGHTFCTSGTCALTGRRNDASATALAQAVAMSDLIIGCLLLERTGIEAQSEHRAPAAPGRGRGSPVGRGCRNVDRLAAESEVGMRHVHVPENRLDAIPAHADADGPRVPRFLR